uniref:Uncharacterized protein n=1 Tax=Ditylenchus dipsaci TaxID=166011 RepID=A0A915E3L0_9BILA
MAWIGDVDQYEHICFPKNVNEVAGTNVRRSIKQSWQQEHKKLVLKQGSSVYEYPQWRKECPGITLNRDSDANAQRLFLCMSSRISYIRAVLTSRSTSQSC